MTAQEKIGNKLKRSREKLGLNQSEIAQKVGINTNYYARIERGVVNPSLKTLQEILKVLKK